MFYSLSTELHLAFSLLILLFLSSGTNLFGNLVRLELTVDCNVVSDDHELVREVVSEVSLRELEEMLACVVSETAKVEEEYKSEQNIQKQVRNRPLKLVNG